MNLCTRFLILLFTVTNLVGTSSCNAQRKKNAVSTVTPGNISATENKGKTFEVTSYFNGFNTQMMRGPKWHQQGFIEKVKALYPGVIRYPGGTVASYWDWKTGWLMEGIEIKKEWKNIPKNPITLEDIKFACDQTGADPLFVLNMMTSNLAYQMEMLKHAAQIGLVVKFIELDNELYLGDPFYVSKFENGKTYALECNKWISSIKKEYPGVRIAVVGNSVKEGAAKKEKKFGARTESWNGDVLSLIKDADAMTFHIYGGTGLNYIAKLKPNENDQADENSKAAAFQQAFENPTAPSIVLGIPYIRWNTAISYDYKILPKGMKAWVTEYNLFEREGVVAGTWAHGLYAVTQTLLFMENNTTELACYHNLTTSAQFGAIFNDDQAFMKAYKTKNVKALDFTAAGYCLSLSGKAMSDAGHAIKLNFSGNTKLDAARGQQYPALNGWVIKRKSGKRIILTNLSSEGMTVDFSTVIQGASYTQYYSQPVKQIASESDLTTKTGKGEKISLPAYSVTLIEGE